MKKLILLSALVALPMAANAKEYKCYRYVNDKPTGTWIKVEASSKEEASGKAYRRMKELGGRVDYAKCKY